MASRSSVSRPGRNIPGRARSLALKMAAASVVLSCSSCALFADAGKASITVENRCHRPVAVLTGEGYDPTGEFYDSAPADLEVAPGESLVDGALSMTGHFVVSMRGPDGESKVVRIYYEESEPAVVYEIEGPVCTELGADGD